MIGYLSEEAAEAVIAAARQRLNHSQCGLHVFPEITMADHVIARLADERDRLKAAMPTPSPDFAITRNISEGARRALKAGGYHGD